MASKTLFDSDAKLSQESDLIPESLDQIAKVVQQLKDSSDAVEYTHADRTTTLMLRGNEVFVVQSNGSALRNGRCPLFCRTLANNFEKIVDVSVRLANPGAAYGAFFSTASSKPAPVLLETLELRRAALESFVVSKPSAVVALENRHRPIR